MDRKDMNNLDDPSFLGKSIQLFLIQIILIINKSGRLRHKGSPCYISSLRDGSIVICNRQLNKFCNGFFLLGSVNN